MNSQPKEKMNVKKYLTPGNLLVYGSDLFAIVVLLKVLVDRYQLPPGVCPTDANRPLIYLAIAVLLVVNVGSWLYDYRKKKQETKS